MAYIFWFWDLMLNLCGLLIPELLLLLGPKGGGHLLHSEPGYLPPSISSPSLVWPGYNSLKEGLIAKNEYSWSGYKCKNIISKSKPHHGKNAEDARKGHSKLHIEQKNQEGIQAWWSRGMVLGYRTERTKLLNFDFTSIFFIKENDLQTKKSRTNIVKGNWYPR